MTSAKTFIFPGYRTGPTTCTEDYYPAFLCDYGTFSIKLLGNNVRWSTMLPSPPMKRMVVWMYLKSSAWLSSEQLSIRENKGRKQQTWRRLFDEQLPRKKAHKDRKYYGHLLFLKKSCKIGCVCFPPF